jgi:hypothetical protein
VPARCGYPHVGNGNEVRCKARADLTVRYVAVPAVIVVCGYRMLAARKLRSGNMALVVAAVVSVPLESALRAAMVHFTAFVMV